MNNCKCGSQPFGGLGLGGGSCSWLMILLLISCVSSGSLFGSNNQGGCGCQQPSRPCGCPGQGGCGCRDLCD